MIGVFSDSHGDLSAFDAAYELLRKKGAKRFFFAGGRFTDLDEWLQQKREKARGGRSYSDSDFLADISNFLASRDQVERPPAFFEDPAKKEAPAKAEAEPEEDVSQLPGKFTRTPERDCLAFRDPNVNKKVVDMIGDTLCCLVHDKNDLDRDDLLNAVLFVHGKEAEPKVVQIGPRFFLAPGKLTGAAEQTCGLIEQVDRNLTFSAFTLDGRTILDRQPVVLSRNKKISVK